MSSTNNWQAVANQVVLIASIVGGNHAGQGADIFGGVTLEYVNLIQVAQGVTILDGKNPLDPNAYTLAKKYSIFGRSPMLGQLQKNGGPTETDQLLPHSPAINAIPLNSDKSCATESVAEPFDQLGVFRPLRNETGCDLGAVEHRP